MRYDIRFPAGTPGWRVAAGLDMCYQIPTNLIQVNRDVDVSDVLAVVVDDAPVSAEDFSVRLHARNLEFGNRVARHSPLAVALNLAEYLKIPNILPGPGLEDDRWWLVRPDRSHNIVTLDAAPLQRGAHVVVGYSPTES